MFLLRILPGILKEFVKHVPTVLFEVIDWNELTSELPKLSKRLLNKEGFGELIHLQQDELSPINIQLAYRPVALANLPKEKWVSEKLLEIYFAQIFSPHGVLLDLRLSNFMIIEGKIQWHPSSLWIKFDEHFSAGLKEIYEGFYMENDVLFRSGLIKTGLLNENWPETDQNELTLLFKTHFGASVHDEITFDIETFKLSMSRISEFMLKRKVKITKDFLYLGLYLVSLYSSLEGIPDAIRVRDVYLKVKNLKKVD